MIYVGSAMDRGAWQALVHGVKRAGHGLVTTPPPAPHMHGYTTLTACKCTAQGYYIHSQRCEPSPPSISESPSCKTRALLIKRSLPTLPEPLAPSILLSVSANLMTLSTLCKWDHRACLLLWTASFTECSALQVHPCCNPCQNVLLRLSTVEGSAFGVLLFVFMPCKFFCPSSPAVLSSLCLTDLYVVKCSNSFFTPFCVSSLWWDYI